ncbi:MAG: hypothetical protein NTX12_03965 [Actinobacteria bacterium]|nr:hypothetical protein [Actinomycetota bacterium]
MNEKSKHHHGEVTRRGAIVAALLRFEAATVISLAAYLTLKSLTSHPQAPMALAMEILFALLGGLGLLAAGHGFANGRNYGRAPAVLANLIALGVSIFQFQAHLWFLATPLALIALITTGLALSIIPE